MAARIYGSSSSWTGAHEPLGLFGIPRSTSISARAFVSTTCEPRGFLLGPITQACTSRRARPV